MFQWTSWKEGTIIGNKEADLEGQYLALHFSLIGEPTQTIDRQVFISSCSLILVLHSQFDVATVGVADSQNFINATDQHILCFS